MGKRLSIIKVLPFSTNFLIDYQARAVPIIARCKRNDACYATTDKDSAGSENVHVPATHATSLELRVWPQPSAESTIELMPRRLNPLLTPCCPAATYARLSRDRSRLSRDRPRPPSSPSHQLPRFPTFVRADTAATAGTSLLSGNTRRTRPHHGRDISNLKSIEPAYGGEYARFLIPSSGSMCFPAWSQSLARSRFDSRY